MYRRGIVQILSVIILCSGCGTTSLTEQELMQGVDSIAGILVPDSRENLFSVEIKRLTGDEFVISGETNLPEAGEAILDYLANSGVRYIDSLKVLPDTLIIKKKWGLVTVSVCNMKKTPSYASELVSQAVMGTPVKLFKKNDGWLLCQTPDNYLGWINESSIQEMSDEEIESWRNSKRLIFTGRSGDIFITDTKSEPVSDIVVGSILADGGSRSGKSYITLPDGRKGYIAMDLVCDFDKWCSAIKPEPDKLIRFARTLLGRSYLWGGTSAYAMDCSGFVKTVFFTGGIILSRDASQQFLHGIEVDVSSSIDSLKPADLVFFGNVNKEGTKKITHVGMYISDTEVIHCSGMVRINSLDPSRLNYSEYLGKRIMGARRLIGAGSGKGMEPVALSKWYISQK